MIEVPSPPDATQIILEAYLRILEEAGQQELIAMYAGALGDNAVERYALFLVNQGTETSKEERMVALRRAAEQGLDEVRVGEVAAERTVIHCFNVSFLLCRCSTCCQSADGLPCRHSPKLLDLSLPPSNPCPSPVVTSSY